MCSKFALVSFVLAAACGLSAADKPALSAFERSQGWKLVSEDKADWRGFGANKFPATWSVKDGSLIGAGGAIVSEEQFGDFELQFNWRVEEGGRGAVLFRVNEDAGTPSKSGPQMQLAGAGQAIGGNGLDAPDQATTPQPGVWYSAKLVVFGNVVEHWINGSKVASYAIESPAWKKSVAASPLGLAKDFGIVRVGRIALEGEKVEFRNVKIRAL